MKKKLLKKGKVKAEEVHSIYKFIKIPQLLKKKCFSFETSNFLLTPYKNKTQTYEVEIFPQPFLLEPRCIQTFPKLFFIAVILSFFPPHDNFLMSHLFAKTSSTFVRQRHERNLQELPLD